MPDTKEIEAENTDISVFFQPRNLNEPTILKQVSRRKRGRRKTGKGYGEHVTQRRTCIENQENSSWQTQRSSLKALPYCLWYHVKLPPLCVSSVV